MPDSLLNAGYFGVKQNYLKQQIMEN